MKDNDINEQTPVDSLVEKYPWSVEIFQKHGINVIICGQPVWDSIEEVCKNNSVDPSIIIAEIKNKIQKE